VYALRPRLVIDNGDTHGYHVTNNAEQQTAAAASPYGVRFTVGHL
jgi:hypothetical protein